ncbi:hypothetical protein AINA4_02370 [Aurantimicrobium sp. INA4]|nr:hypothetical protein AINA4_02370 [Aurantimicrobium sp. INA4]
MLSINKDLLKAGNVATSEVCTNRLPRDQISNGVAVVKGIHEVTDFNAVPYKGALQLGDSNLVTFHLSKQIAHWTLVDAVFGQENPPEIVKLYVQHSRWHECDIGFYIDFLAAVRA